MGEGSNAHENVQSVPPLPSYPLFEPFVPAKAVEIQESECIQLPLGGEIHPGTLGTLAILLVLYERLRTGYLKAKQLKAASPKAD